MIGQRRRPANGPFRYSATEGGLSLVELVLVVSILGLLGRSLVMTSSSMGRVTSSTNTQVLVQEQGQRALRGIIAELRQSGFVNNFGGLGDDFPVTYSAENPPPGFEGHAHPEANHEAEAGDPDFGLNQEIIFLLPADADNDGRPDVDPNGVVWGADEISFAVVTRNDGRNHLERRVNGVASRRIANGIERLVFERGDGVNIPFDSVRVRIFLRSRDPRGTLYRDSVESVFRLRNGDQIEG